MSQLDASNAPSGLPELTQAEAAAIFDGADALLDFSSSRGKPKLDESALVIASGELTDEHLQAVATHQASGDTLGSTASPLKALRHTHHRLAQLLAVGTDETVAAKLCNYSVSRVSILKSDPAFQELLAYYAGGVQDQWADFVATAAGLNMDFLQELQRRLDENPEQFSAASLMDAVKLLADRTGHAPVTKSVSVNVNADVGSKLEAARRRLQQLGSEAIDAVAG